MNKKGNNAWILCPSKSFPGKLYYFNVITGEAAWCINEEEKRTLTKDVTIKKVSDKSHPYPEPNTPPTEDDSEAANISYNFSATPNIPLNYHMGPPPVFGQPVFSRYIPNQYMPGYVMPMPQMFVANKQEPKKRTFDQITQTSEDHVTCVQGFTMPLSKRFGTYRQVKTGTKTFETNGISTTYNKGYKLSPNKVNWWNTVSWKVNSHSTPDRIFGQKINDCNKIEIKGGTAKHNIFEFNGNNTSKIHKTKIIKDPVLTLIKGRENINPYNFIMNHNINKTNSVEKSMLTHGREIETENNKLIKISSAMNTEMEHCIRKPAFNTPISPVSKVNWVQNTKCEDTLIHPTYELSSKSIDTMFASLSESSETSNERDIEHSYLDSNDLRLILQAKRQKLKPDTEVTRMQSNDISQGLNNQNKLKNNTKHVTFDLPNSQEEWREEHTPMLEDSDLTTPDCENVSEIISPITHVMNICYLKSLAKSCLRKDPWYLVVDIGVLLDDFDFIEKYAKKDSTCKLLIPNSVRSYIETMSVGEYAGRSWVMLARKAMRRLSTPGQHIVLQPPVMEKSSSAIDGTIECCLLTLRCNHAVLITTDTELYNKGTSTGIPTFKLDDIKKSVENEPPVTFEMGRINVTIDNDNMFMRKKDNFEPYALSKNDCLPVNDSVIWKVPTTVKKNQKNNLEMNKIGTNNPVIFDKSNIFTGKAMTNKIKPNHNVLNFNAHVDADIENDIKFLSIHENSTQNKLSEIVKNVTKRCPDLNVIQVIRDNNIQKDGNKDKTNLQDIKSEHHRIFGETIPNPAVNLRNEEAAVFDTINFTTEENSLLKQPVKPQNKHLPKEKGHRQKNKAITTEDLLKRFQVKDITVSQKIERRFDEWICCFCQIMEEFLTDILMNNSTGIQNKLSPPWTLLEAVLCVNEIYCDNSTVSSIADKLCTVLSSWHDKHGNMKSKIKSADFMRLLGCGVLLVESLKSVFPRSAEVLQTERLLNELLHRIQDPSTDVDLPYTPMRIVTSEIDDTEPSDRNLVPKEPSVIIEYLKKHFPAWRDFDERHLPTESMNTQKKNFPNERTIIRTLGKNLNNIRISNAQRITFDNSLIHKPQELKKSIQKDIPKVTRTVDNVQTDTEIGKHKTDKHSNNDLNKDLSPNDNNNKTEVITSYSNRKYLMEDDISLDYEEFAPNNDEFVDDVTIVLDVMVQDDDRIRRNEEISFVAEGDDKKADVDDDEGICYDATNDSGFVNESLDACSFIRLFLMELSASFKLIYNFIEDSILQFRRDMVQMENKKILYDKANVTHLYVADIIGKLKRIIDREASGNTKLKELIINAGVEALTDKRITRYRQVVMKCLEQAQLLEDALKTMLALTNEHCDIATVDVDTAVCHVPYFNIFE